MTALVTEATIGSGSEAVYVYFADSERRLARLEGRDAWPCKVGRSKQDVAKRILQQRPFTAMAALPVVGLLIRTTDAVALETQVHQALRYLGASMKAPRARDWFHTSPEQVIAIYEGRVAVPAAPSALSRLKTNWNPPLSGTLGALYIEIVRFLDETGMSATRLGKEAIGDPAFMTMLCRGRDPLITTVDKIRAFMAQHRRRAAARKPGPKRRKPASESACPAL